VRDGVRIILVVPCFNEEHRFLSDEFLTLARQPGYSLVLVDDGSSDQTKAVLERVAARSEGLIEVLALEKNRGKAEAVRLGLLRALERGPEVVGYIDADLATPVEEIIRLVGELFSRNAAAVLGSRVALLGHAIDRHAIRHYSGRVFATLASLILNLPVYDTQCGAKIFRASPSLRGALERRFISRWAFDVELIGRLLSGSPPVSPRDLYEVPLLKWTDIPGSKVRPSHLVRVAVDLASIARELYPKTRA